MGVQDLIKVITKNMASVFLGQVEALKFVVCALLSGGHVLLEGVPGVGKTLIGLTLSRLTDMSFARIQFTNDMLPSDVIGFHIFRKGSAEPELVKGPVFAGIVLADEINRTPPKTQSALLEAMEEKQVSIDGITYPLSEPFMIIATENPVEVAGVFPLPESQLDRFLLKLSIGYPGLNEEKEIISRGIDHSDALSLKPVISSGQIIRLKSESGNVMVHEDIIKYILSIVRATRVHPSIDLGVSPRGGLALKKVSQAWAFIHGRDFVVPDDVKKASIPVLAHRIIVNDGNASEILEEVLEHVSVPL